MSMKNLCDYPNSYFLEKWTEIKEQNSKKKNRNRMLDFIMKQLGQKDAEKIEAMIQVVHNQKKRSRIPKEQEKIEDEFYPVLSKGVLFHNWDTSLKRRKENIAEVEMLDAFEQYKVKFFKGDAAKAQRRLRDILNNTIKEEGKQQYAFDVMFKDEFSKFMKTDDLSCLKKKHKEKIEKLRKYQDEQTKKLKGILALYEKDWGELNEEIKKKVGEISALKKVIHELKKRLKNKTKGIDGDEEEETNGVEGEKTIANLEKDILELKAEFTKEEAKFIATENQLDRKLKEKDDEISLLKQKKSAIYKLLQDAKSWNIDLGKELATYKRRELMVGAAKKRKLKSKSQSSTETGSAHTNTVVAGKKRKLKSKSQSSTEGNETQDIDESENESEIGAFPETLNFQQQEDILEEQETNYRDMKRSQIPGAYIENVFFAPLGNKTRKRRLDFQQENEENISSSTQETVNY